MILERHYLDCLAQASYLIVDEPSSTAVVVDPRRDVQVYLEAAAAHGATIRHVLLTHFHADFVSGHLELAAATGATIHLGAAARTEYPSEPMAHGDALAFGDLRITALATPGHTPESTCYLLHDLTRSATEPQAVFTGDTLFIGDVGRPDLMASVGVTADELARSLYASLHEQLLSLPDATVVYPGHGAGSACGKALSDAPSSTIGEQRRLNAALQPMTADAFVALVTTGQSTPPAYFGHDARLNRQRRPTLGESLERGLRPLSVAGLREAVADGARVLDTRDAEAYAAGHLAGSLNVGLGGRFATWAGSLLDPHDDIVVIADPGREGEAITRLGRIGLDRVRGYLDGGHAALTGHDELLVGTRRQSVQELAARLQAGDGPTVVDVRTPGEFAAGHIAGALNLPLGGLPGRLASLPETGELAVVCLSGYRSSAAASLIAAHRDGALVDVVGGMQAWQAADLPLESDAAGCVTGAGGEATPRDA